MSLNEQYERILSIVCSVFEAYSAVLFLPGGNSCEFELAAKFSLGDKIRQMGTYPPGKGLVGWIIRDNSPLLVTNFDQKRSKLGYYEGDEETNIKAFMGCPIPSGGALCIDSKRTYSFSEKDQKILQLFARLVDDIRTTCLSAEDSHSDSRFYASLRSIAALRNSETRWNSFLDEFLRTLARDTGFDYCFFAARDEWGRNYYLEGCTRELIFDADPRDLLPVGSGLVGWVFKNGQPIYSGENDCAGALSPVFGRHVKTPELRSIICLPILANRVTRGVLGLAHHEALPLSESLRNFSEMAADHLALFLENLYLKSRLQRAACDKKVAGSSEH